VIEFEWVGKTFWMVVATIMLGVLSFKGCTQEHELAMAKLAKGCPEERKP
jgi:hypothetical protein